MMSFRLSSTLLCLLSATHVYSSASFAQSQFIPKLELNEQYIENNTSVSNEDGFLTRVSPGFQFTSNSSRSNIMVDYSLDAITSSGLSQKDEVNHNLTMRDSFTHIPGRWKTEVSGNVRRANVSSDGIQQLNPYFSSDNTTELRTIGANTDYTGRMAETVWFNLGAGMDYSSYKDGDNSNGYNGVFSVDNNKAHQRLSWQMDVKTQVSETGSDSQQIDTAHAILDYRISQKLSTFVDVTDVQTDYSDLNENVALLGINWTPGKNTRIKLAAGKRGNEDSYSLDSSHKTRKATWTAKYEETITTTRDNTLAQQSAGSVYAGTVDSLSIIPVLQKYTSIDLLLEGRRSSLRTTLFQTEREQVNTLPLERINGIRFAFKRQLSSRSSFNIDLLSQHSKATETNDLNEVKMSYQRSLSQKTSLELSLSKVSQDSTNPGSEYDQNVLEVLYSQTF